MIEEFQEHFDEHDLQVLNMQHESADWEARLKTIETEVEFLQKLLNEELIKELSENSGKNTTFSEKLNNCKNTNADFLQSLQNYLIKQEGLKECDDVQCENFYLKDHLIFKNELAHHFNSFRKLKTEIYKTFKAS